VTRNPYMDLCLSVQALRRHFEGIRTPLAPAVGVAASIYTHQLANVHRVLTDVRVRHLLADEVGLGKTVQALMVLNALRSQRPGLRVLVVVPARLVTQWRDEILTRAHTAPMGEDEGVEGEQRYIRLAWEAQLRMTDAEGKPYLTLSEIDPGRFDVLVVDELHHLSAAVQDRIVRIAADFEHLLVLTATPAFQQVERHAQLFALLEPERTTLAKLRIARSEKGVMEQLSANDDLSKWPEWAAAAVVEEFIERDRDAAVSSGDAERPATAIAHCAYRRVIRARRTDYGGILPRRRHHPLVVEPLGAEADRQALMWQYFDYLGELSRRFDPILLAKRVILSPPSLEQRVDFFRREGHERGGLLERVKPLVHRSQGDSRADALVDLLVEIWSRDRSERVLVTAQDSLTVDYLFDLVQARLPVIGPIHDRIPLVAARVRQGMTTEAVEDLSGFGNETTENLEAFQRGEAQVLFVPEVAQVGLNLQCARVLVLYSVPWRPEEVEQWIGRLDRIGNSAAFSNQGEAKTIDVYTITHHGLVDDKVVRVLQRFRVFERSVNLDGDHLEEVAGLIEDAALRPESVSWRELEEATEVMAEEDEVQELESALKPHLPWTVDFAMGERQRLEALPPAAPVLKELPEHAASGPRGWDRAFEGMLKLLKKSGDYHIRWKSDLEGGSGFQTLWYQFGERGMYGQRDVLARVVFSFGADPGHERSPRHAHAFITRRGDIGTPPRRSVTMSVGSDRVRRPLRFLSFGDALHDELVSGWLPNRDKLLAMDVGFFDDHDFWKHGAPGLYVLRICIMDPASVLLAQGVEERSLKMISLGAARTSPERLPSLIQPFAEATRSAIEADVRWLRAQLAATMNLQARRRVQEQWVTADAEETKALLNPLAHGGNGVPPAVERRASHELTTAANEELSRLREADTAAAPAAWGHRLPEFEDALRARLLVVREEGYDAIALASEELRRSEDALAVAVERGNRGQITRAENTRDSAADTLRMTEVFWQQRCGWLQECEQGVRSVLPREYLTALLRAVRTR
jgi:ATP-dependent helicase HepA